MKKNALGVLLIALAVTIMWSCGQSTSPQADLVAKKANPAKAATTPVTVVDEKKAAVPAKTPAAGGNDAGNPANAEKPAPPPEEPLPEED